MFFQRKCSEYVKCYGFNYEFERGTCKYLAGASECVCTGSKVALTNNNDTVNRC